MDDYKQIILDAFSLFIRKLQNGYSLDNYTDIRESMLSVNMIENFEVPSYQSQAIIDYYSIKLKTL
jgi:hypothetical protein